MAEGGGLLNRYTVNSRIVGSNPIPSAILGKNFSLFSKIGNAAALLPILLPIQASLPMTNVFAQKKPERTCRAFSQSISPGGQRNGDTGVAQNQGSTWVCRLATLLLPESSCTCGREIGQMALFGKKRI